MLGSSNHEQSSLVMDGADLSRSLERSPSGLNLWLVAFLPLYGGPLRSGRMISSSAILAAGLTVLICPSLLSPSLLFPRSLAYMNCIIGAKAWEHIAIIQLLK